MPVRPVPAVSPTGTGAVQLWPPGPAPGREAWCLLCELRSGWQFFVVFLLAGPRSWSQRTLHSWTYWYNCLDFLAGLLAWRHHERGHLSLYLSGSGRTFISVIQPIRKAFPPLSSPATWLGFLEPEEGAGSLPTSRALLWLGQPWAAVCGRGPRCHLAVGGRYQHPAF